MVKIKATLITLFFLIHFLTPIIAQSSSDSIIIGSKKFNESIILGDIFKVYISKNYPDLKVQHKEQLGSTRILWNSLLSRQIDIYPEYTGTLEQDLIPPNYKTKVEKDRYLENLNIGIGYYIGFNNTYALGITSEFSQKYNLRTISDLKKINTIKYAFSEEFLNRKDGWPGLKDHYNLQTNDTKSIDHDIAYRALLNGDVQVIDLYSTDAEIKKYNLVILEDDLNFFSKYEAIYLYNKNNKALENIFKEIRFKISEKNMVDMNYNVKFLNKTEEDVARLYFDIKDSAIKTDSFFNEMLIYSYQHLWIVGIALFFGIPLGIFLGTASHYYHLLRTPIVYTVSIFQTVPSIAFLVLLIGPLSYFGFSSIGNTPAIITLFLYSLMPITTTTLNALDSIPKNYIEISDILNINSSKRLFNIQYPLAAQEILNSIKNTVIATIGSATLGALVGAGGLGQPILSGIRLDNYNLIIMGITPSILFIILTHFIFKVFQSFFISKGLKL